MCEIRRSHWVPLFAWLLILVVVLAGGMAQPVAAQTEIPPVENIVFDDFESGNLGYWTQSPSANLNLVAGAGRNGSVALSVPINAGSNYLYQAEVFNAVEGYVTFWFNPNGVSIPEPTPNHWPPDSSIIIADVMDSSHWRPSIVSLHLRRPPGGGYKAYLSWPTDDGDDFRQYDYDNAFDISSGWQKITIGYCIDGWVAVWRNDVLMRSVTDVVHEDAYGDLVVWGKTRENSSSTPSGSLRFDDLSFQVRYIKDIWVNISGGSDTANTGLTPDSPFKTIQKASTIAGPGTTVHILPGVYRGTVTPSLIGNEEHPVIYKAENGAGTVKLRGSGSSVALTWTQLTADSIGLRPGVDPTNIYYADISSWGLAKAPRYVVELDSTGEIVARLPLAREPDWTVKSEWKYYEYWWTANGGSYATSCNPATNADSNCDINSRSLTQLTDTNLDSEPSDIESGNLTTVGNLTGGTLVAMDTIQGHYAFRRTITSHNVSSGRVTVGKACVGESSGAAGLGWGTKYYVENKPYLLDSPGEWWYDAATGRIYLWPRVAGNPGSRTIEISRRDYGFNLRNRSYTVLDGLVIEFQNDSSVYLSNYEFHRSYGVTLRDLELRYANYGVYLEKSSSSTTPSGYKIDGFSLLYSEIAYMDSAGLVLTDWWSGGADPNDFTGSRVLNTSIRYNEFHHLAFRSDSDDAVGLIFTYANRLRFEGNSVHHVAHNGAQFSKSVIQSSKTYGFSAAAIKTGEIIIKDNIFSKACQMGTDCGGLKIWGLPPDAHVFRDLLITGNVFRNNFGWSYVGAKRGRWSGGSGSAVRGLGGFGLYVDMASGVHVYRNIAYNNGYTGFHCAGVWRDGQMIFVNNVAANNFNGLTLGGLDFDTHGSVDTRVLNNILVNNEGYGTVINYATGRYDNIRLDFNLYYNNGWRSYEDGGLQTPGDMVVYEGDNRTPYATLAEAQAATQWEDSGVAGDPSFWSYTLSDHDLFDGSWADFHPRWDSAALDKGIETLPLSLRTLLTLFGETYEYVGDSYDIGRYERGFVLKATPSTYAVDIGGATTYEVQLLPSDLPHTVTLSVSTPSSLINVAFDEPVLAAGESAILTVLDRHETAMMPGEVYTITITGVGNGYEVSAHVLLIVGGDRIHLPVVMRRAGTE